MITLTRRFILVAGHEGKNTFAASCLELLSIYAHLTAVSLNFGSDSRWGLLLYLEPYTYRHKLTPPPLPRRDLRCGGGYSQNALRGPKIIESLLIPVHFYDLCNFYPRLSFGAFFGGTSSGCGGYLQHLPDLLRVASKQGLENIRQRVWKVPAVGLEVLRVPPSRPDAGYSPNPVLGLPAAGLESAADTLQNRCRYSPDSLRVSSRPSESTLRSVPCFEDVRSGFCCTVKTCWFTN